MAKTKGIKRKKVMVFGVFDGLHEGHRYFLKEARKHGSCLIAVVACDKAVKEFKGHTPLLSSSERIKALEKTEIADEVVLGDKKQGSWNVVLRYKPETVVVGYDQFNLKKTLESLKINFPFMKNIIVAQAHKPSAKHSS